LLHFGQRPVHSRVIGDAHDSEAWRDASLTCNLSLSPNTSRQIYGSVAATQFLVV